MSEVYKKRIIYISRPLAIKKLKKFSYAPRQAIVFFLSLCEVTFRERRWLTDKKFSKKANFLLTIWLLLTIWSKYRKQPV
jgi:hypothetical protein